MSPIADPTAITNQTVIRARESTANKPSTRAVKDVEKAVKRLDPDLAPLLVLTKNRKGGERTVHNPQFFWQEKELPAQWTQINNGAGYNAAATDLVVDHARYISVGDVLKNVRTGEQMRTIANVVATNTVTVVRAVGSTAAAAMLDNDDIMIVGNAYAEGAGLGAEKSHIESQPYNYTQIMRTPFGVTGTEEEAENYTGPALPELRAEALIDHRLKMERVALFGERGINTTNVDNPLRYAGGFLFYSADNSTDVGGTLTEPELETALQGIFTHSGGSSGSRTLFASPLLISVIDQLAASRIMTVSDKDATYGIAVTQWVTGHGTLNIVKHPLLDNGLGGSGYGNRGLIIDTKQSKYVKYGSRGNTKLRTNIGAPGDDGRTDEYLTEFSWQWSLSKVHGQLTNITG